MTWLTWRQHRTQVIAGFVILAGMGIFVVLVGELMYQGVTSLASSSCTSPEHSGGCPNILNSYTNVSTQFHNVTYFLLALPVLIGMFVGAPLVAREYEQQTFKTAWTQSVTRGRWLGVQVALLLAGTVMMSGVLAALVAWADHGTQDQQYTIWAFDLSGIAPISYAVFALALALAAGTFLRRTVPAMFTTLVGYLVARVPIDVWARPHYLPPVMAICDLVTSTCRPSPNGNTDWYLDSGWLHAGRTFSGGIRIPSYCSFPPDQAMQSATCMKAHGWSSYVIFQPADRYWIFQGIEAAIFFGLAALLLALAMWCVRRRIG